MTGKVDHWQREVVVAGQKVIEPDSRIVEAFKNIGYSLQAALADLVDNSIDARATHVLIRFLRTEDELVSLVVVDNGAGMSGDEIDRAMQFGGGRRQRNGALGMYGMGLKSASLSQADKVTVLSRANRRKPVGRRWTEAQAQAGWRCDIVDPRFASNELGRHWDTNFEIQSSGTIVRWDDVRDFQKASGRVDAYLRKVRRDIANHLGLQLHRFLANERLSIIIDVENIDTGELGIQTSVVPLDPFGYGKSGDLHYPKTFQVDIPSAGSVLVVAHIWPARSKLPGYTLGGGSVSRRQGIYFYRNDRLIQAGGWNNLRDDAEPHLSLARAALDLTPEFENIFSVRFNKSGVDAPRSFVDALEESVAFDGASFRQYIERAIDVYRSKSTAKLKPIAPPGSGMKSEVQRVVRKCLPVIPGEEIAIVWQRMAEDCFFDIDRERQTLAINSIYRRAVLGGQRASRADAALVKMLLCLLLNENFLSQRESAMEKSRLRAFQTIMVAAAKADEP